MADLISRQAAIEAIKTWGLIDGLAEGQAIEILADEEKLPSAQPERKTGRWINIRAGNIADCDQCGYIGRAWMNYCPVCGSNNREDVNHDKR